MHYWGDSMKYLLVLAVLLFGAAACAPELASSTAAPEETTSVSSPPGTVPWTPAPPPQPGDPPFAVCQIKSTEDDPAASAGFTHDYYSVVGATNHPRGTVFVFTVAHDGEVVEVPLVADAGSAVVNGVAYGNPGTYEDVGQTNFGNTSADMPSVARPHGPVTATVTLDGQVICTN